MRASMGRVSFFFHLSAFIPCLHILSHPHIHHQAADVLYSIAVSTPVLVSLLFHQLARLMSLSQPVHPDSLSASMDSHAGKLGEGKLFFSISLLLYLVYTCYLILIFIVITDVLYSIAVLIPVPVSLLFHQLARPMNPSQPVHLARFFASTVSPVGKHGEG